MTHYYEESCEVCGACCSVENDFVCSEACRKIREALKTTKVKKINLRKKNK